MEIGRALQQLAESLGTDYFGIADLKEAQIFIRQQGGPEIAKYPIGVTMGIALLNPLVELLPDREKNGGGILYRHHAYDVVNTTLDQIALQVANTLQREGYNALPVAASRRTDDARICGPFSQKLAAHLAGLGWIGRSCSPYYAGPWTQGPLGDRAYRCPPGTDRSSNEKQVRRMPGMRDGLPGTGIHRTVI